MRTILMLVSFFGAYFMGMMSIRLHSEASLLPWVSFAFFVGGVTPWFFLLCLSLKPTHT